MNKLIRQIGIAYADFRENNHEYFTADSNAERQKFNQQCFSAAALLKSLAEQLYQEAGKLTAQVSERK